MSTKTEVLQAISEEKTQVTEAFTAFTQQIEDLKKQLADGGSVTPADLDEITNAVHNIFVPNV